MQHCNFYLYSQYFGEVANDGEGTIVYGYETCSETNQKYVGEPVFIKPLGGCFISVQKGSIKSKFTTKSIEVDSTMWQSTTSGAEIILNENTVVSIFQRIDYVGMDTIGVLEKDGRLKYIDGCKDSILFQPIVKGYPCFNALYMPIGVRQTMHTHPSTRAGIILEGNAYCETPEKTYPLEAGMIFFLPKEGLHKFRTDHKDGYLKLLAYHPDSDFGPDDQFHPMINKTLVEGVSASYIDKIRTK